MSVAVTPAKPRGIRFASAVFVAGLIVAGFIGGGSYWYWQTEKKDEAQSQRALQDMRARLETVKRERDELRGSEATYKSLVARGVFAPEKRMDLIETMNELRKRHRLVALEYDVFPQRPLKVTGASYASADIRASRMRIKVQAYHDAELLQFLEEFSRIQRGFFPMDRCVIKRTADFESRRQAARAVAGASSASTQATAIAAAEGGDDSGASVLAAVEADCTLEWITLTSKDDSFAPPSRPAASAQPGARKS
jgi:hypothetical protein